MTYIKDLKLYCVDLGSRAGLPSHWEKFVKTLEIDAFDPDVNANDKGYKKIKNVKWYSLGLANKTGRFNFYITSKPSGSSLYEPNDEVISKYSPSSYWRVKEKRKLNFLSFKDFLHKFKKKSPDLIKLDTQGSELDILKSLSSKQLDEVLCIEIEAEFIELYKDQPLFRDIDLFLSKKNFEIMDLRTHRSFRVLNEIRGGALKKYYDLNNFPNFFSAKLVAGDAIYIKKIDETLIKNKLKFVKVIKIMVMYHFFDEAINLVEYVFDKKLIKLQQKNDMINYIIGLTPKIGYKHKQNSFLRKFVSFIYLLKRIFSLTNENDYIKGWTVRKWPDQ